MLADDLDSADRVMRLAFGTIRGLPDPEGAFGDSDSVRTRFSAAPDCAWVAELEGNVVGSVFAARWGSFGFFGPLSVHPDLWDRGIGGRLLQPVVASFTRWAVRQAGLFTFAGSLKHLGLYQKHGFWPGALTIVTAKAPGLRSQGDYALFSDERHSSEERVLEELRALTDRIFPGLDLEREIRAVSSQELGDTILVRNARDAGGNGRVSQRSGERGGRRTVLRQVRGGPSRRRGRRAVRAPPRRVRGLCRRVGSDPAHGRRERRTTRCVPSPARARLSSRAGRGLDVASPRRTPLRHGGSLRHRRSSLTVGGAPGTRDRVSYG